MVDDVEITVSVNEDAESFSNAKMLIIVCEVWQRHGRDPGICAVHGILHFTLLFLDGLSISPGPTHLVLSA